MPVPVQAGAPSPGSGGREAALRDALLDAQYCTRLQPGWAKGYGRCGAVLLALQQWEEAQSAYEEGLELEPANATLRAGLTCSAKRGVAS